MTQMIHPLPIFSLLALSENSQSLTDLSNWKSMLQKTLFLDHSLKCNIHHLLELKMYSLLEFVKHFQFKKAPKTKGPKRVLLFQAGIYNLSSRIFKVDMFNGKKH